MLKLTTLNKITTRRQRPLFPCYFPLTTLFGTWALIILKILLLLVITGRYAMRQERSNLKTVLLHRCGLRKFNWWQIVKTRLIRLRVIEGPNSRDEIAFLAFHSFWVKSKWMLATYRRRICINSLEIRIVIIGSLSNDDGDVNENDKKAIGHSRVPKTLTFKMRPSVQAFLWKWVLFEWEWKIISTSNAEPLSSFWYWDPGELGIGLYYRF